jgi:hypothetical protein
MLSFDWNGIGVGNTSSTELSVAPGIGMEKSLGSMTLDLSARMNLVDGGSRIGFRAGIKKTL